MSYSRWGEEKVSYSRWGEDSPWYVYYMVSNTWARDKQLLDICGTKTFNYRELKDDIEECLDLVRILCTSDWKVPVTEEQLFELKGYMLTFINDVESDIDINNYEALKNLDLDKLPQIIDWVNEKAVLINTKDFYDRDEAKEVKEALGILFQEDSNIPLLLNSLEYDLGKLFLELRLKGSLKQIPRPTGLEK